MNIEVTSAVIGLDIIIKHGSDRRNKVWGYRYLISTCRPPSVTNVFKALFQNEKRPIQKVKHENYRGKSKSADFIRFLTTRGSDNMGFVKVLSISKVKSRVYHGMVIRKILVHRCKKIFPLPDSIPVSLYNVNRCFLEDCLRTLRFIWAYMYLYKKIDCYFTHNYSIY